MGYGGRRLYPVLIAKIIDFSYVGCRPPSRASAVVFYRFLALLKSQIVFTFYSEAVV